LPLPTGHYPGITVTHFRFDDVRSYEDSSSGRWVFLRIGHLHSKNRRVFLFNNKASHRPDTRKNFALLWNITDDDQLRIKMNIFAFGIGNLGGPDLLIILLIVLILFGAKKLPDLARSLGQSMNEFRKAREDIDRELHNAGARPSEAATLPVRAATGKVSEPDR
jgi:TatA/E family protein of Tat protein translocase